MCARRWLKEAAGWRRNDRPPALPGPPQASAPSPEPGAASPRARPAATGCLGLRGPVLPDWKRLARASGQRLCCSLDQGPPLRLSRGVSGSIPGPAHELPPQDVLWKVKVALGGEPLSLLFSLDPPHFPTLLSPVTEAIFTRSTFRTTTRLVMSTRSLRTQNIRLPCLFLYIFCFPWREIICLLV